MFIVAASMLFFALLLCRYCVLSPFVIAALLFPFFIMGPLIMGLRVACVLYSVLYYCMLSPFAIIACCSAG